MPEQDARAMMDGSREALWRGGLDEAVALARQAVVVAYQGGHLMCAATSLDLLGDVATRRGEVLDARKAYAAALSLYRQFGSAVGEANVELSLGHLAERLRDLTAARAHFAAALTGYRDAGRDGGQAQALQGLGKAVGQQGDRQGASEHHAAALEIFERLNDREGIANVRYQVAALAADANDANAVEQLTLALRLYEEVADKLGQANALLYLARTKSAREDRLGAKGHLNLATRLYKELDSAYGSARCLELAGDLAEEDRDFRQALSSYTAAEVSATRAGDPSSAAWLHFRIGTTSVVLGSVAQGVALVQRARGELASIHQGQHSSALAEIDRWLANFHGQMGLPAKSEKLCPCGSGEPFRQCHGQSD